MDSIAHARPRPSGYIPSLDGIRAASIVLVLLSHTACGYVPGGLGVTVFFFLSGYLITTLMRMEREAEGRTSIWKFYLRRTLRIFPPLYVTLFITLFVSWLGLLDEMPTVPGFLAQAFYYTNYWIIFVQNPTGLIPSLRTFWSVAVEEHFYLVFPLLFVVAGRLRLRPAQQALLLLALWLLVNVWRYALAFWWHVSVSRVQYATDTRIDTMLMGCVLAVIENPFLDSSMLKDETWKRLFWVGLTVILITAVLPGVAYRETLRYSLQTLALVPIFIAAVRFPTWSVCRWLNNGWVRTVGRISYSLYLVHQPAINFFHHMPVNPILRNVLGLAAAFVLSAAMYAAVEKPCASLRKRFL